MPHVNELEPLRQRYGQAYPAGQVIFRQGDPGDDMFIILEGTVVFTVEDRSTRKRHFLRTAGPGEIFGEVSCFGSGQVRSATATAVNETEVLRLHREVVVHLITTRPAFAMRIIHTIVERLRTQIDEDGEQIAGPVPASVEESTPPSPEKS